LKDPRAGAPREFTRSAAAVGRGYPLPDDAVERHIAAAPFAG